MNFNLDFHGISSPEPTDLDTSPGRLVTRNPLLEIADHGGHVSIIKGDVVRVDAEYLFPALATCSLQDVIDVAKGLINLLVNVECVEIGSLVIPTACTIWSAAGLLYPNIVSLYLDRQCEARR